MRVLGVREVGKEEFGKCHKGLGGKHQEYQKGEDLGKGTLMTKGSYMYIQEEAEGSRKKDVGNL